MDTGASDAGFNMAVDEMLLHGMRAPHARPVLRFYAWSVPAITVGYFQDVLRDFHFDECQKRGWDVVRRLTGGRAVFHDDELTYSVILPDSAPAAAGGVLESYRSLSRGLLQGLRDIGVNAELVSFHGRRGTARGTGSGSPNCFASASWYEIKVGNRKLVGSAQRRLRYGILQQGSILISTRRFHEFHEVFRKSSDKRTGKRPVSHPAMTSLTEVLNRPVDLDLLKLALLKGFQSTQGVRFEPRALDDEDLRGVRRFQIARYQRKEWNLYRRSPRIMAGSFLNHPS